MEESHRGQVVLVSVSRLITEVVVVLGWRTWDVEWLISLTGIKEVGSSDEEASVRGNR